MMEEAELTPGGEALVKGSFEIVHVLAVAGDSVLVKRAGGQINFRRDQLEPYAPDVCLI